MNTVIFDVASADDFDRSVKAAFRGEKQPARISFASPELLVSTMTLPRLAIVRAMAGVGALSVAELAQRILRDIESVDDDVQVLLNCGVLDQHEDGRVIFPFDAVHVDFMIEAAA